jgi:hypothetical protein
MTQPLVRLSKAAESLLIIRNAYYEVLQLLLNVVIRLGANCKRPGLGNASLQHPTARFAQAVQVAQCWIRRKQCLTWASQGGASKAYTLAWTSG